MPGAFDSLHLDNQLCFALYSATHAITRAYRPLLAKLGITYPQYLVLVVLWEHDGIPVGEIARRLQLDAAALTPLVKRLEGLALVQRERDSLDERIMRISLTAAGRELQVPALSAQAQVICRTQLDQYNLGDLRSQLKALVEAIGPV